MQLYTDSQKDLRLLDLRGLAPLNPDMAGAEMDLLGMIESHNLRCSRALARLRQLADDRRRLGDFDVWQHENSAVLLAERARLHAESWDALWEARHALEEREDVLVQIQQRLYGLYDTADQEHGRTVAIAEKRLARERRRLERTNPSTAKSEFTDLVAADEAVQTAKAKQAALSRDINSAAEARRNLFADLGAVTKRQQETHAAMVD